MPVVKVPPSSGSLCPILVGDDLLSHSEKWLKRIPCASAIVVYDTKLKKAATALTAALRSRGCTVLMHSVRVTERAKDVESAMALYTKMIKGELDRDSVLFAIGGGVIGDLSGFVASTFLRGIRWISIPTTLLAQVDSGIGGKTGVNHPLGKNLIGTFHQPSLVVCDTSVLAGLSQRDRVSGLAEMIKYGLVYDPSLYRSLVKRWDDYIGLNPRLMKSAITKCARHKGDAVEADERDLTGVRQILNFGHTFGHALEAATGYGCLRHGEAVIIGMRVACSLSAMQGHLREKTFLEVDKFLSSIRVPKLPPLTLSQVLRYTKQDKKRKEGRIAFVLLTDIGKTVIDANIPRPILVKAVKQLQLPFISS
jgi:3-dehydroquinate synthase